MDPSASSPSSLLPPHCLLPPAYCPSLAQATLDLSAFLYIGLLIILAVVGGLLIFAAKRRIFSDKDDQNDSNAGLMATLDAMLRSGQISRAEYDQTRRRIIEKTIEKLDKPKPTRDEQHHDLHPDRP